MCLFIVQKKKKRKEKENQYKIRKIKGNKRKEKKLLVFKCPITVAVFGILEEKNSTNFSSIRVLGFCERIGPLT